MVGEESVLAEAKFLWRRWRRVVVLTVATSSSEPPELLDVTSSLELLLAAPAVLVLVDELDEDNALLAILRLDDVLDELLADESSPLDVSLSLASSVAAVVAPATPPAVAARVVERDEALASLDDESESVDSERASLGPPSSRVPSSELLSDEEGDEEVDDADDGDDVEVEEDVTDRGDSSSRL